MSQPIVLRDLYVKNGDLKEDIEVLQERKEEVYDSMRDLYDRKYEAREKFLNMDNYVRQKEKELAETKVRLEQLQKGYEPYKAQEDINMLVSIFPKLSENLQMAQLCRDIGLAIETIKEIFTSKEVTVAGKLYSQEHDKPDKLHLSLNGQNITDWFKEQFNKLHQTIRQPVITPKKSGEIKI